MAVSRSDINNFDILSSNYPDVKSNSNLQSSQGVDINFVQKPKLTPEQKQEMVLLGLTPENDADVQKYLTMTPEEKTAQIKQFETGNQPVITETPTVQTTDEQTVSFETPAEQNVIDVEQTFLPEPPVEQEVVETSESFVDRIHEEIQKLGIDTNSDEWKAKSNEEKMNTVLLAGAKSKYTEEEWNSLSKEQKITAGKEFAKSEISKFIPDWDTYSDEKKLEVLSKYANMALMAKDKGIKLSELLDLKTQNPKEFEKIAKSYYKKNSPIDFLSKGKEIIYEEINSSEMEHNNEFEAYLNSKGFIQADLNIHGKVKHEREFLEQKIKSNKKLTEFQERRYEELNTRHKFQEHCKKNNYEYDKQNPKPGDLQYRLEYYRELIKKEPDNEYLRSELSILEELASRNGGNLENMTVGELEISNIGYSLPTPRNFTELSIVEQNKVYDKIAEYLIKNLGYENLSEEEQVKLIQQFDSSSQVILLRALDRRGKSAKGTLSHIDALIRTDAATPNSSKVLQDSSVEALGEQINYLKDHNLPTDGFTKYMQNVLLLHFDKSHAQQAGWKSWELGEKFGASANKGIAKREDAPEVFEGLNDLIYNSDTISDELKELYAQTSVEYLSPEYRDAQAERLRSYGSESFNKGVETGYENVKTGNTSSNNSPNTNNTSTSVNDFTASLNKIQNSSSQVIPQEVENIVKNLDLSNPDDAKKFADIVDKYSNQISNYLAGCSLKQKEDFIEKFCSVASRSQIMAFLKNNPSLYNIVLKYSHGLNNEEVFRILMSDERNKSKINDIMESLTLNPIDVARNNKEFAVDIALLGDNKDLALDILKNPNIYGYSLGDRYTTVKLNRVASEGNYPPRTQNNKPFLEKA